MIVVFQKLSTAAEPLIISYTGILLFIHAQMCPVIIFTFLYLSVGIPEQPTTKYQWNTNII